MGTKERKKMTVEEFEKTTWKQRMEYGKSLKLGPVYENGKQISFKDENGFWNEWTYDERNNPTLFMDEVSWKKWTYDESGKVILIEDNEGFWEKWTYGKNGKRTSYGNSYEVYTVKDEEVSKEEYEEFIKS